MILFIRANPWPGNPTYTNAGREWTGVNSKIALNLAAGHHFCRRPTIHVGLIEYDVRSHVCWPGGQHHLLAVHQIGGVEGCELKSVAVRDRVSRTRLDTVSAENAAVVVDVVDLGIALGAADAVLRSIFGRFDINAVRRARRRAQEAGDAFLEPVFVALQHVRAAETRFNAGSAQRTLSVRIILDDRRLEHLQEGDAHALGNRGDIF